MQLWLRLKILKVPHWPLYVYYIIANVWVYIEAKPHQPKKLSPSNSLKQVTENPPMVVDCDTSSALALNASSLAFEIFVGDQTSFYKIWQKSLRS